MDNDLNRSVKFLEDALSASGRGLLRKSLTKRHLDISDQSLDSYEVQKLMSSRYLYEDSMTDILGNKTITGSIIQANLPWKTTVDGLYMEFFEILQGFSGSQDVLEIITELARCCSDALNVIRGLKSKVAVKQVEEEQWLEKERDTWRLLFILYQDRLMSSTVMNDVEIVQYFGRSEKCCAENLFKRQSLVRECQLVVDWLECQAAETDDEVLHFSDSTVGWENSLHQLQSADTIAFESSRQIVDKLDPDVVHYQRKPLHDLDMDDEKSLNKKIFREIRSGKLEEAEKLCRQCGHAWKAAIFEGWRLFHNPNLKENYESDDNSDVDDGYEEMDSNELKDIEGNSSRDIWKIMALQYCKQDYLSIHEKASVASFCGYVDGMLPICNCWEDNLWAYMKAMVDIRVESELRDCCVRDVPYEPLPEYYWSQRMSLNEVFSNLESSRNMKVRQEALEAEHIIQKYVILDEIDVLLGELERLIKNASSHFLRFAAHLVLFFYQIGRGNRKDIVENIIEAYIRKLMEMNETCMVAFYVSKLSPSKQAYLYAQHLEKIIDNHERKIALNYALSSGLDVFAVTKQVVENIRNLPQETDSSGNLQQKLSETDKLKISALDWVIFDENQRREVLIQSNALIFSFLTMRKLDAAQLTFNKIPMDTMKTAQRGENDDEVNQLIKEHLSYKVYLDAQEAFNEWFMHVKKKPIKPEPLSDTAQLPEIVAHQHKMSQYKAELERWKLTVDQQLKSTKARLYNVLEFPEGWLLGAKDCDYLRSIVIPEITSLIFSLLMESELYEECPKLMMVISSEKQCLYESFTEEQIENFLMKMCECVLHLMDSERGSWRIDPPDE